MRSWSSLRFLGLPGPRGVSSQVLLVHDTHSATSQVGMALAGVSAAPAPSPWSQLALPGVTAAWSALMHMPCVEMWHWKGFKKFLTRRHEASRNSSGQQSPEMLSPAQGSPGASHSLLLCSYQAGMPRPPAILTTSSIPSPPSRPPTWKDSTQKA